MIDIDLTGRARRIVEAMRRWLDPAYDVLRLDDALYRADTAELRAFDRRQGAASPTATLPTHPPTGCPIFDCPTCEPDEAPPPRRARDVAGVAYWLRTECPEVWNETPWAVLDRLGCKLLALQKAGEIEGRWDR